LNLLIYLKGIDTIPMILGLVVASILSGALVARVGYYLPFLYLSCVLMPLGAGLLTTLKPSSSNSAWIGYQILLGFGIGSGMQQSNLAVQTCLADSDVPTGISIIFFFQMLGGSVFSAVAQNIFIDRFIKQVAGIPGLNAEMIVKTGATAIRDRVPKEVLPRVIDAYNYSITHGPFLVSTIIACLAIFGTVGMEWRSVKEKKNAQMAKHGQKRRSKDVEADATSEVASADGRTPSTTTVEKPQPSSVDIESEKHHHKETAV
jgi:MFS family permease